MQRILLFGSDYRDGREVHAALKRLLNLPEYYGMNADALHDCLDEQAQVPSMWIGDWGEGETACTLRKVAQVIQDLGGEVKEM